jgi:hypothetical protein
MISNIGSRRRLSLLSGFFHRFSRSHAGQTLEGGGEILGGGESEIECDSRHGSISRREAPSGLLDAEAQGVFRWRYSENLLEKGLEAGLREFSDR